MKKSIFRRVFNRVIGKLAALLPGAESVRPFLHKLRGVQIQGRVFIGDEVYLENEYPEAICLEDGAQLCLRSIVIAHTNGLGRVVIKRDAFVGANSVISATKGKTLTIGEGAVVSAGCCISSDIPDHALVGYPKPTILARANVPLSNTVDYDKFILGLRTWKK